MDKMKRCVGGILLLFTCWCANKLPHEKEMDRIGGTFHVIDDSWLPVTNSMVVLFSYDRSLPA